MKGSVKVYIYLSPRSVFFFGDPGKKIIRKVDIKTTFDRPLTLKPVKFDLKDRLKYKIEEIKKGREFRVSFETIPGTGKMFKGSLKFQTNYPEKPELIISIRGRFAKQRMPGK